ncbi:hypothetical protein HPB51_018422 [Rhipicephalus microplus]|uniref:Transposable element P transposase-like RNase H domain-containing protein n=1 Tax=Rhipicephalus microplus TaxID=6941 RepID=A0A9J6EHM6_RHIMP|nr:hypothetical protein HPB51_018422 [Rhipicephalus microplus]
MPSLRKLPGVRMFDEMSVRKSLHFRESDMALLGKVNFAEHTRPGDNEKDADHVLVFLFQPFLGGWSQTVRTFCASSAAPGSVVAKLLLQCIVHLENSGAVVQAVTCDNSTSNRSALRSLGIHGDRKNPQTSFQHPCDPIREIYTVIDPPHIFKCIRNNLQKVGKFLVDSLAILLDDVLLEPTESEEEALADLSPKECILDYLAGYVAQKFSEMCCTDCVESLKGLQRSPSDLPHSCEVERLPSGPLHQTAKPPPNR